MSPVVYCVRIYTVYHTRDAERRQLEEKVNSYKFRRRCQREGVV